MQSSPFSKKNVYINTILRVKLWDAVEKCTRKEIPLVKWNESSEMKGSEILLFYKVSVAVESCLEKLYNREKDQVPNTNKN